MTVLDIYAVILIAWRSLPDPHALVPAAGGDEGAGWAPCHPLHLILMAFKEGNLLPYATLQIYRNSPSVYHRFTEDY